MNPEVPVIPNCDKILTKIRAGNADRQRRYQERGGKNQRRPHDHRDDVINELKDKVLDLREEIQQLKREIRELKLNQRDYDTDTDRDTDSDTDDDLPPPQPPHHEVEPEPEQEPEPEPEQEPQPEPEPEQEPEFENIHPEAQQPDVVYEENPIYQEEEEKDEECKCEANVTIFTLPVIIKELKKQEWNTAGTLDTTIRGITAFFRIVGCDNIPACLVSFENVKSKLDSSTQVVKTDSLYSTNSKKTYIQSVLICITRLKIPIDGNITRKYLQYFNILKMQAAQEAEVIRQSPKHSVISFPNYLRKIKERFGETSKQYLIAMMYSECTCRDNYAGISIVASLNDANDEDTNYLVMVDDDVAYFVLHKFKTSQKYGTIQIELSDEIITLLKNYINTHNITNTLFGENAKNGLSDFIGSMNKKVGVAGGGVNALRHMMVETILSNTNATLDERLQLANRMGHSPAVQIEYRRILRERESQQQSQSQSQSQDEETKQEHQQQEEKENEHDALEKENNIRRENMRLQRIERERNYADQPEPKKQKKAKGQGLKRKESDNVDDTNTKKQMITRSQKRKGMDESELPPAKITRKVTIN